MSIKGISWLAMAGVVSVLSACGSSSPSSSTSTGASSTPQSPAESAALARYVERGDQLCRYGNAAIAPISERGAEIQRRHGGASDEVVLLVPVLREGLRVYRRFLRRFEQIAAPPSSSAQVATIAQGLSKVGDDIERLVAAVARGELAQVKAITSEREMDHDRVSAQELEFGFKVCGQPAAQSSSSG
jgi:hypothetical protein